MTTKYNRLTLSLESSEASDYSANVLRHLSPFIDTFTGDAYPHVINLEVSTVSSTIDTGLLGSIDYTVVYNRSTSTSINVTIYDDDYQQIITLQSEKLLVFPTTSTSLDISLATASGTADCIVILFGSFP